MTVVLIGGIELEFLPDYGDEGLVRLTSVHDGTFLELEVEEARRLQAVGLPAVLPRRTVAEALEQAHRTEPPQQAR